MHAALLAAPSVDPPPFNRALDVPVRVRVPQRPITQLQQVEAIWRDAGYRVSKGQILRMLITATLQAPLPITGSLPTTTRGESRWENAFATPRGQLCGSLQFQIDQETDRNLDGAVDSLKADGLKVTRSSLLRHLIETGLDEATKVYSEPDDTGTSWGPVSEVPTG